MANLCKKLWRDSRGATAIEYGLIVSLVVIAIVAGISSVGGATGGLWGNMANKVAAVTPNA
ncbi:Flp family type IVb pilin [Sphingomonas sp.]|uniref:Flp family type IVb pilin n=1 Tax=Sphingomonas sp. TaxID=28214 RepID=UPI000DB0DC6D|nr:Flp family type IVb pilin [Sphingomonas sp.]PZU10226.1 MAG: Flp family type IVb pilin [Sphingomonas sp.]